MDIDDILASVSAPSGDQTAGTDLQELTRAWVNEKCAPELLPWPTELMERVLERVRKQIELIEYRTGDMDPRINFALILQQTDLERHKFLVRNLLRTRLSKIDQHGAYYLSQPDPPSSSFSPSPLLSPHEQQYATHHQSLLATHFTSSFLGAFPESLQRLDDTAGGINMVEGPDANAAVFVRGLRDVQDVVEVVGTDIEFEMQAGMVYVVRWSAVRERVLRGEAELI